MGKNVEDVVDAQIRRWQSERRAKDEAKTEKTVAKPVVTISREYGARGADIGRAVAKALEFGIWDHEIVHAIAEKTGAREALLDTLDEHARGAMEEIFGALSGRDLEAHAYARQLGGVIRSVAHHGAAVIVGRGGQYIVDPASSFRVRILQPLDERAADFAKRHGLDEAGAIEKIEKVERDRQAFVRQHFGEDVASPGAYDLVVNRAGKTVEQTTAMIVAAYRALYG